MFTEGKILILTHGHVTQVLIHVSTYQGNPFWNSGFLSRSHIVFGRQPRGHPTPKAEHRLGLRIQRGEDLLSREERIDFFIGLRPTRHKAKKKGIQHGTQLPKANRPFHLLVFPFWSSFSHGPKRLTFYFWVLWASEGR